MLLDMLTMPFLSLLDVTRCIQIYVVKVLIKYWKTLNEGSGSRTLRLQRTASGFLMYSYFNASFKEGKSYSWGLTQLSSKGFLTSLLDGGKQCPKRSGHVLPHRRFILKKSETGLSIKRSGFSINYYNDAKKLYCYATSRKVAGSSPDEVIGFFSIDLILPAALWPWGSLSL
jgi:hypothetical protein